MYLQVTVISKQKNFFFAKNLKATDEKGWIGNLFYGSRGQDPDP